MTNHRVIERVLLIAGAPGTGKSVQLRSMFLDPRLGTRGEIPERGSLPQAGRYSLSEVRRLYVRLSSPHEHGETLEQFLEDIERKTDAEHRWNVARATQINARDNMPDILDVVAALEERFEPERIRIAFLSPNRRGVVLAEAPALMAGLLAQATSCEVLCIDARDRERNGLLLADTFDFISTRHT